MTLQNIAKNNFEIGFRGRPENIKCPKNTL